MASDKHATGQKVWGEWLMVPLRARIMLLWQMALLFVVIAVLSPQALLAEEIPLINKGGVYQLPVEINGVITLHFVLDTGASDVNLPADVALTLHRAGTIRDADFLPGKTYTLADSSTVNSARFVLRHLKIGNRRVTNVAASIGPVSSELLLGQSFLEKLGPWVMDSQRQVLTLGARGQRTEPLSNPMASSPPKGPQVAVGDYPSLVVPKTIRNSIGMEFVLIPAGTFQMGANYVDGGDSDEQPVHTVHITQPFYLGKYEVTQEEWQVVMGKNPSGFNGEPTLPVERVSWDDVHEFIVQLNARERGTAHYRLPTEAEWEYAARAGSTTAYSFGDLGRYAQLGRYAWYKDNAGGKTHPVGQLQPNVWGLYDMSGNVWEWLEDWMGTYPSNTVTDPIDPTSGARRVHRGGGWDGSPMTATSAYRGRRAPGYRLDNLGFRLLRVAP